MALSRSRRGASPIPFVIFMVFWLVSCYYAYDYNQRFEKSRQLNLRKKIDMLKVGENIPGLKDTREGLDREIRKLKMTLGYMPDGKQPDSVSVENVVKSATVKLNKYLDDAIPKSKDGGVYITRQSASDRDVKLMINGEYIQVPVYGQLLQPGKLSEVQYALNLEGVVRVLRLLSAKLTTYKDLLKTGIESEKGKLDSIKNRSQEQAGLLEQQIRATTSLAATHQSETEKVRSRFSSQIKDAKGERSLLEQKIQDTDKQITREKQVGNREVQSLQNQIVEANKKKGNLRRKLGAKKLRRQALRYATRQELVMSTVETDRPDGEIVLSDAQGVWINLGSQDKIRPGLIFFVFSPAAGDFWTYRAKVQVLRVQKEISQVRMIHVEDKFAPVSRGDKIFNKVYRTPNEITLRNDRTRVAFVGKFQRFEKRLPFIKSMLKRLGAQIDGKLTHWTNLVIVENGYEEDPDFIKATRDLNIEVLTIDQLREFIAY